MCRRVSAKSSFGTTASAKSSLDLLDLLPCCSGISPAPGPPPGADPSTSFAWPAATSVLPAPADSAGASSDAELLARVAIDRIDRRGQGEFGGGRGAPSSLESGALREALHDGLRVL